jgi:cell division protein FtsB
MISKRTRHLIFTALGAAIVGYFLYHTVYGDRGLFAMMHLQGELARQNENLQNLKTEREELEHRIQLLRPKTIDPDMLDQEARRSLNYSKPKEIIILTPKKDEEKK